MTKRIVPDIGDQITHHEPFFKRETSGTVTSIMTSQFAYKTPGGLRRLCLFTEDFTINRKARGRRNK